MKRLILILLLFITISFSCNQGKVNSSENSQLLQKQDLLQKLKSQKQFIDTLFSHSTNELIVVAKLTNKGEPVLIKNRDFPESVVITYNFLKDSSGKIITVSEFPFSESGDWSITLTHYFDENGRTFAFERQANFFNSICTSGAAYETNTEFYNVNFQQLDKVYKLVDEKNNPLAKDSCQFPYDYEYKISKGVEDYLKSNNLGNYR